MNDLNLQLVREFFEFHRFRVMTHWSLYPPGGARNEQRPQLYVENTEGEPEKELEMVLGLQDLGHVGRAVVEVRAWHTDRFYASLIESNPVVTQFAGAQALGPAREFFGGNPFKTILVVSELPHAPERRAKALESLEGTGIDHLIEFPTVLQHLVAAVSLHGAYGASTTLQLIQLLKRYRLVRNQQMEFPFPFDAPPGPDVSPVETAPASMDDDVED